MCNIDMHDMNEDGMTVEFHLVQTSRYGWELILPRETDAIKVIIDRNGVAVYREQTAYRAVSQPLPGPSDAQRSEFLERWILV
jgi:hypothetical protein